MDKHQTTIDQTPDLFWESVSESRWGQYISEVEERHIMFAHQLAGAPMNATEIGAEGGRWASKLADLGWNMTCTDIVEDAVAVCQQRIPDATCICVDVNDTTIPCDDLSQRLLLCIEVHEILETDWFMEETV